MDEVEKKGEVADLDGPVYITGKIDPNTKVYLHADSDAMLPDGSTVKLPAGTVIDVPWIGVAQKSML